jgi:hypothetical protein
MNAFAASSAYDPAVNKVPGIAVVSSTEPAVEVFSPPVARSMSDT